VSTIGLAQEGLEVLYMVNSMDEYLVQELKEVNGKTFKSTKSAGLGLGDEKLQETIHNEGGESKSRLRQERARWSRPIVEKLGARMDDFARGDVQGKQSEVVNKHICGSTGELMLRRFRVG